MLLSKKVYERNYQGKDALTRMLSELFFTIAKIYQWVNVGKQSHHEILYSIMKYYVEILCSCDRDSCLLTWKKKSQIL